MSRGGRASRDRAWQMLVALVMDSRGDWRRKVVQATGLPFTRARALWRLDPGPLTLSALAESMTTDAPAATVIVNDLEKRGLVTREPHPTDKRAKVVSLTREGRAVLRSVRAISDHAPAGFDKLTAEEVAELTRLVMRLREGTGAGQRLHFTGSIASAQQRKPVE